MTSEHFEKVRRNCHEWLDQHLDHQRSLILPYCESSLERLIGEQLVVYGYPDFGCATIVPPGEEIPKGDGYFVAPQFKVGNYRADFALVRTQHGGTGRLFVECDGWAWHDRKPEQAERDKQRDRFIMQRGWPVMRFAESEIRKRPQSCTDEAWSFLFDKWVESSRAVKV